MELEAFLPTTVLEAPKGSDPNQFALFLASWLRLQGVGVDQGPHLPLTAVLLPGSSPKV